MRNNDRMQSLQQYLTVNTHNNKDAFREFSSLDIIDTKNEMPVVFAPKVHLHARNKKENNSKDVVRLKKGGVAHHHTD